MAETGLAPGAAVAAFVNLMAQAQTRLAKISLEALNEFTMKKVIADDPGWVKTTFTKRQLEGKMVYFALPPQNEKFFGHLHVEKNARGKFRITIEYGGPDSTGQIQAGKWDMDQAYADQLRKTNFVIPLNI